MNLNRSLQNRQTIAQRIEEFYILCIYPYSYKRKQVNLSEKTYDQSKVIVLNDTIHEASLSKSFIVWAKNYEQNEALFYNIRMQARQETVIELSKSLVAYSVEQEKALEKKLKNPLVLEGILEELQKIIHNSSFITEQRWNSFFAQLTNEVKFYIVERILQQTQFSDLQKLNDEELNYLFFDFISLQLDGETDFTQFMVEATNRHMEQWLVEIIAELTKLNLLTQVFSKLTGVRGKISGFAEQFTVEKHLFVMNNLPYQIVRETIYKNNFTTSYASPFPTAQIIKGNTEGFIEINPIIGEHPIQYAWEQILTISDIDVDVFDALCNIYLSKNRQPNELVTVTMTDLLNYRGLKPKRSGDGRRGGYDAKQKKQIMQSLTNIQSIKLNLTKLRSFEKGKPTYSKLSGRTFLFKNAQGRDLALQPNDLLKEICFTLDEAFSAYLAGTGRQVALLHMRALQYHPTQQLYEKRLCRYLSWRWRTQARKGDYLASNMMSTMLESIGVPMNERLPSRTRERVERALDQLQKDGVIQSWQYEKWDESIADFKGWGRVWLRAGIIIEPPKSVVRQYATIEKRLPKKVEKVATLKEIRLQRNHSLIELAEILSLSITELSEMERGKKPLTKKLIQWMES